MRYAYRAGNCLYDTGLLSVSSLLLKKFMPRSDACRKSQYTPSSKAGLNVAISNAAPFAILLIKARFGYVGSSLRSFANTVGELAMRRDDRPTDEARDVLEQAEAEDSAVAHRPGEFSVVLGAERLRRIFDDRNPLRATCVEDRIDIADQSVEVRHHDGADVLFACEQLEHLARIDVAAAAGLDVGEQRNAARA